MMKMSWRIVSWVWFASGVLSSIIGAIYANSVVMSELERCRHLLWNIAGFQVTMILYWLSRE